MLPTEDTPTHGRRDSPHREDPHREDSYHGDRDPDPDPLPVSPFALAGWILRQWGPWGVIVVLLAVNIYSAWSDEQAARADRRRDTTAYIEALTEANADHDLLDRRLENATQVLENILKVQSEIVRVQTASCVNGAGDDREAREGCLGIRR